MSTTETWTIGRLLTWTTEYLQKHGSASPRLDAEVLLAHARECQRIELYTTYGEEPSDQVKAAFREMVRRRCEGTPVAYLVGHKEFYSLDFEVNPDVLIPRPETEHLIVQALDRAAEMRADQPQLADRDLRIADVGTGSGNIAVSMALHCPCCQVTAIDLSSAALDVARRNAQRHGLTEPQIRFVNGDLLASCDPRQPFDLILSNPPYISQAEYQQLDETVREFEPQSALLAGPHGWEVIARLLAEAPRYLMPHGVCLLELSPMLAETPSHWMNDGWQPPSITKDLAGHARIVSLRPRSAPDAGG